MEFENILYEVQGPMGLITINRPAKHNAISLQTLEELHFAVDMAHMDDDVTAIVITGAGGRAFASGSGLSEVRHPDFKKALEPDELLNHARAMVDRLAAYAPFVPRTMKAMVNDDMEASLAGALMFEKYAQGALVQTEDGQEGIDAFLEKRKPDFKGR